MGLGLLIQPIVGTWPPIACEDQIPAWLRDNEYILTGHPMPTHSTVAPGVSGDFCT